MARFTILDANVTTNFSKRRQRLSSPFTAKYNPNEAGREHSCFGKIKAIQERTGLILTHDEISYLCTYILKAIDAADFYRQMDGMSDKELTEIAWKAKRRPVLTTYESLLYA